MFPVLREPLFLSLPQAQLQWLTTLSGVTGGEWLGVWDLGWSPDSTTYWL